LRQKEKEGKKGKGKTIESDLLPVLIINIDLFLYTVIHLLRLII